MASKLSRASTGRTLFTTPARANGDFFPTIWAPSRMRLIGPLVERRREILPQARATKKSSRSFLKIPTCCCFFSPRAPWRPCSKWAPPWERSRFPSRSNNSERSRRSASPPSWMTRTCVIASSCCAEIPPYRDPQPSWHQADFSGNRRLLRLRQRFSPDLDDGLKRHQRRPAQLARHCNFTPGGLVSGGIWARLCNLDFLGAGTDDTRGAHRSPDKRPDKGG